MATSAQSEEKNKRFAQILTSAQKNKMPKKKAHFPKPAKPRAVNYLSRSLLRTPSEVNIRVHPKFN